MSDFKKQLEGFFNAVGDEFAETRVVVSTELYDRLISIEKKIDQLLDLYCVTESPEESPEESEEGSTETTEEPKVTYVAISYTLEDEYLHYAVVCFAHGSESLERAVAECLETNDYDVLSASHNPIEGFSTVRYTNIAFDLV